MKVGNKEYYIKVSRPDGNYVGTIAPGDFKFNGFHKQINGGLGAFTFTMPRHIDDYGEGSLIDYNNRVDLIVVDIDSGADGRTIYSGFMVNRLRQLSDTGESVQVTCFSYVSKIARSILRDGTTVLLKTQTAGGFATSGDASDDKVEAVFKSIIDRYQAEANNPVPNYTAASIASTGSRFTYTFDSAYFLEALEKCVEAAPPDWWFYMGADNVIYFQSRPSTPRHYLALGKDFTGIDIEDRSDAVANNVLFSSNGETRILNRYVDSDSVAKFDDVWIKKSDSRVETEATADSFGYQALNASKAAVSRTSAVVIDNNNANGGTGYDIENIEPGDTIAFTGFNDITSPTFSTVRANYALSFDGIDDVLTFDRPFDTQADYTVSFYLKTTETSHPGGTAQWYDGYPVIDFDAGSGNGGGGVSVYDGKIAFGVNDASSSGTPADFTATTPGTVNDGSWHHIVVQRLQSSGYLDIYVDNVRVTHTAAGTGGAFFTGLTKPPTFYLGQSATEPLNLGTFVIDNLCLYGRALTTSEIATLYAKGSVTSGMTNGYRFNEGTGTVAYDDAGSSNLTIPSVGPTYVTGCEPSNVTDPLVLQVVACDYTPETLRIELEDLSDSVARSVVEARKLAEAANWGNQLTDYNTVSSPYAWHVIGATGEPAYQNSWSNYDSGSWVSPAFMKDAVGFVHLRGLIQHATSVPSGVMFTLPAGYRPATVSNAYIFSAPQGNAQARIEVYSNGDVYYRATDSPNAGSVGWVSLNMIHFQAVQ